MVNNKLEKNKKEFGWKFTIDNFAKENAKTLIINVLHGLHLTMNY